MKIDLLKNISADIARKAIDNGANISTIHSDLRTSRKRLVALYGEASDQASFEDDEANVVYFFSNNITGEIMSIYDKSGSWVITGPDTYSAKQVAEGMKEIIEGRELNENWLSEYLKSTFGILHSLTRLFTSS